MKLGAMPKEDTLGGVQQIQEKIGALHIEIQNLRKEWGKGASADLWCIRCQTSRHTKDQCPLLVDYMQEGSPSLLRLGSSGSALWCDEYWVAGLHDTTQCPWLIMGKLKQQWCRFC